MSTCWSRSETVCGCTAARTGWAQYSVTCGSRMTAVRGTAAAPAAIATATLLLQLPDPRPAARWQQQSLGAQLPAKFGARAVVAGGQLLLVAGKTASGPSNEVLWTLDGGAWRGLLRVSARC